MIIAGIDYSMSCPSICIYDTKTEFKIENCQIFFLNNNKKFEKSFTPNLHGFKMPIWEKQEERFDIISSWVLDILTMAHVKLVILEGFAMAAKGQVFEIGANAGVLKHKLYKAKIELISPAPTSVKKTFSGKGNANKLIMYEAFKQRFTSELDLCNTLGVKADKSPVNDIIDSFAMVDWYLQTS